MTHQGVNELAPEYVLGSLDEMTRARILAHLSGCPACRAEVAAVSQTFDAMCEAMCMGTACLRARRCSTTCLRFSPSMNSITR